MKPVGCWGGNTGSIDLTVEGATQPYRYQWSNGTTTEDLRSLTASTYSVTVIDANNCVKTTAFTIQEPPLLSVTTTSQLQPTCYGGSKGSISLTATGGVGPYTYLWTNNGTTSMASTPERSDLTAGVYSVVITDANGCTVMDSVTLGQGTRSNTQLIAFPGNLAGPTPRHDGQLILRGFDSTDQFDISSGSIYIGGVTTPVAFPFVPANEILMQSLPNPQLLNITQCGCSICLVVILT